MIASYAKKISPVTSAAAILGLDPSRAIDGMASLLEGDSSLEGRRKAVEEGLREHQRQILVLVDDVDRLHADELSMLLKLVRLVGRLPNVFYVLAYDEATVLDVLAETDTASRNARRALLYLDKIVQVRVDLPPLARVRVNAMIDRSLGRLLDQFSVLLEQHDLERLSDAYVNQLGEDLIEPRQIKRVFGQLEAMLPLVVDEVDFVDFLLITHLRTFYPEVHRILPRHKQELTGTEFLPTRDKPSSDQRRAQWAERLENLGLSTSSAARVVGILGKIFSPLSTFGYGSTANAKRVGNAEYFDRYFYLEVPPDDIADVTVRGALDELSQDSPGRATHELRERLHTSSEPALDKLRRFSPAGPEAARSVLPHACELVELAPEAGFFGRSRAVGRVWLAELLDTADLSDPNALLDQILQRSQLATIRGGCHDYEPTSLRPQRRFVAATAGTCDRTRDANESNPSWKREQVAH